MIRLRELRELKGFSQLDIATKINKSFQAYSHYETGKREPDYETLKKLADLFDVTTDYLLGRETSIKTDKSVSVTLDELEILNQIRQASADKQKAIELILGIKEQAAASSDK